MNQLYELEQQDNLKEDSKKLLYFQKEIEETFRKTLLEAMEKFIVHYNEDYGEVNDEQIQFGYRFIDFYCKD